MNGRLSIILNPGILRRNSTTNGKKPLNNWKNPYNSKIIPTIGHPRRTTKIPPKKNTLALILLDWKKNLHVLSSPTIKAIPARKRIFPIAKSPLSKSKTTPRNRKKPPKPTRPIPIFWVSVGWNMIVIKTELKSLTELPPPSDPWPYPLHQQETTPTQIKQLNFVEPLRCSLFQNKMYKK